MTDSKTADIHQPRPVPLSLSSDWSQAELHLPMQLTSFVGREREIAEVVELLRRPGIRLVTLTGPGGVGKTRLALAVIASVALDFADGVALVPLAAIRDPSLVVPTIAQVLGFREDGDRPLERRLATALQDRDLLLVLDNLEQVRNAAPSVTDLLSACPALSILATSRALLRVSGEHAFPVPSLALPADASVSLEDLVQTESVSLFVERARAVDPGFVLTSENSTAIAGICHRLDGLPLAIELAAARVDVLPPSALVARLTDRLRLLTDGARDQPLRLRSLRNAIAWSYDLLAPPEQALFRCLAMFDGGCTLETAEAVCGQTGLDVVDGITALVHQSLLRRLEPPDASPRFGMLETVREYARERLEASGEAEAVHRAYAAHFLAQAEDLACAIEATAAPALLDRLAAEHNNLRAILAWANENSESTILVRLAVALNHFWFYLGHFGEGRAWLERAATLGDVPPDLRAEALVGAALFAQKQGDLARATALVEEGLVLATACGNALVSAKAQMLLGVLAEDEGDFDRAGERFEEGLEQARVTGNPFWIAHGISNVGGSALLRGDLALAENTLAESLIRFQALGHATSVARDLTVLADIARQRGEYARATAMMQERLSLTHDVWGLHWALDGMAEILVDAGHHQQAARLCGAAEAARESLGIGLAPAARTVLAARIARIRVGMGETALAAQWAEGRALSLAEAVAEAQTVGAALPEFAPAAHAGLTPREVEVLRLMADGHSNQEIADALFISRRTVTNHVAHILAKLGVSTRAAAAVSAVRHGLA